MTKLLSFAAAAALMLAAAAPLSFAQAPPAPANPPAAESPPAPTPAPAPAPAAPPVTPSAPEAAAPRATVEAQGDADAERTCRTYHQIGEPCSCRSAPAEMGAAQAPPDGGSRNICMVPRQ